LQPHIAHLAKAPRPLDHAKDMLDTGSNLGLAAVLAARYLVHEAKASTLKESQAVVRCRPVMLPNGRMLSVLAYGGRAYNDLWVGFIWCAGIGCHATKSTI